MVSLGLLLVGNVCLTENYPGCVLTAGWVGAEQQGASPEGWVTWWLLTQLPGPCSSFSTHGPGREGCLWWHASLWVYAGGHAGRGGLMITLEESSPHKHLKKIFNNFQKKKHDPIFKRPQRQILS